jgi:hypothetical protein
MLPRTFLACALLGSACKTGSAAGALLDPDLMQLAAGGRSVGGAKVRTDEQGRIVRVAVYHGDAQAMPAWARGLAAERWPGSKVRSYESEWHADVGRVFEVEVSTADGQQCEISVTAGGAERYVECEISAEHVPAAVAAAAARLVPGGRIVEAETRRGPGIDELSLEIETGAGEHYLRVRPDGSPLGHYRRVPTVLEVPVR